MMLWRLKTTECLHILCLLGARLHYGFECLNKIQQPVLDNNVYPLLIDT